MKTAVIVDDEPIAKMDLREILKELDFEVVGEASDGFDAIQVCRYYNPDVVLMDIKMPVFDGLGAAETIINEDLAGCVVLLTAYSDMEFIEKAKQIGITGYLVKPLEERLLLPTIEIAMAQSTRYKEAKKSIRQAQEKLSQKNLIDRAKAILAKKEGISESEAFAKLQKLSMDKRCSMTEIAKTIVDSFSDRELISKAKGILGQKHKIGEEAAYRKLQEISAQEQCSLVQAAKKIIANS